MSARGRTNRVIAFTFMLAAAKEDADERQAAELADRAHDIATLIRIGAGDTSKAVAVVRKIMGATWQPTGKWAEARANVGTIVEDEMRKRGINPTQAFAPKR